MSGSTNNLSHGRQAPAFSFSRLWFMLICLLIAAMPASAASPASQALPANAWVLFGSSDCPDCAWMLDELRPALAATATQGLPEVIFVDLEEGDGYELLIDAEKIMQTPGGSDVPVLVAGSRMFHGRAAIRAAADAGNLTAATGNLPQALLARLAESAASGSAVSLKAGAISGHQTPAGVPATAAAPEVAPEVAPEPAAPAGTGYAAATLIYFESPGCRKCARAELRLRHALRRHPELRLHRVSTGLAATGDRAAAVRLQMAVTARLEVPPEDRLLTPMIVSGVRALYGTALDDANLAAMLGAAPAAPFWQGWDEAAAFAAADAELALLGKGFSVPAILALGLADGVNPCAFAVVLFLMSCLALGGGLGRRATTLYGLCFCAGVFICYFLLGIGLLRLLHLLNYIAGLGRILELAAAAACLIFAILAFADAWRAWRHGAGAMSFGTPAALTKLAHRLIRGGVGGGLTALGSVILGMVVSGIELVCTGQIYLPVLVYLNSGAGGGWRSLALLSLYNLAFIVPLLGVVALAAWGTGSLKLAGWARRHAAGMRLAGGLVLLLLAVLLFRMAGH